MKSLKAIITFWIPLLASIAILVGVAMFIPDALNSLKRVEVTVADGSIYSFPNIQSAEAFRSELLARYNAQSRITKGKQAMWPAIAFFVAGVIATLGTFTLRRMRKRATGSRILRDYWQMPDEELERIARQNNLQHFLVEAPISRDGNSPEYVIDRKAVIDQLIQRDTIRVAQWSAIIAVAGAVVSLLANAL